MIGLLHGGGREVETPAKRTSGAWWTLGTLAAIALWVAVAWGGARLYFAGRLTAAVRQGTEQAELQADSVAREVLRTLRNFRGVPSLLAERRVLAEAVDRHASRAGGAPDRKATPGPVDAFLARAADQLRADVAWLLDARGTCVASSNAGTPESFVGTSYADREYFLEARAGQLGEQFAVGRKTGIPGMFFSAPILADGDFAGALVVKINLSQLSYWVEQADVLIADPNGVVIMARDARLEMRSLPGAAVERLPAAVRRERYAREEFPALTLEPWGDDRFPALLRLGARAEPVALISRPMPQEDLRVVSLASFPEIAALDRELVWLFLLLAVGGSGLVAAASGRLASNRQERQARRALRESEERFRLAFKGSPDAIAINRVSDGRYVAVNDGFTRTTGYAEGEVIGRSSADLDIWVNPADRQRVVEAVMRDGAFELEAPFRRKDGTTVVGAMAARLIEIDGAPSLLSVTRDVTAWLKVQEERQQLEEQLRQAQKLESIGRLAGGVAHDFNNLLTVILSCAETLKEASAAGAPAHPELVEDIRGAGERAAALTRQLQGVSRKQVIAPVPLDLNSAVAASEKLLRRVLGEDIELATTLQAGLWTVRCDPGQIEQAILNLAINARDAMPGGGSLAIETRNVQVDEGLVALHPFMSVGPHVRLTMRDSGTGLSPEARAHAFEPFFSTKPQGKGTGLGLATVYGIVKQSGGYILLESQLGQGATFDLYFPRSLEVVPETKMVLPTVARGTETILLVEDDAQVGRMALRSLQALGYRVIVAGTGGEALEVAARMEHAFDLLLTDVIMPGLNGRELADELRRRRPDLRVLYMSGYTRDVISRAGVLDSGIEFLPKPFTAALLQERVRNALDAGWAERLVTGIGEIDAQHRALLASIVTFGQATEDGTAGAARELELIRGYVVDHFTTEERFMRSAGYPGLAQHQAIHGAFVAELQRRTTTWESRREEGAAREVAEWFSAWLHGHIRGPDAEMASYLRSTARS